MNQAQSLKYKALGLGSLLSTWACVLFYPKNNNNNIIYTEGKIKTFHVASNSQVANIFTKALGISAFTRLARRLGLKDIFVPKRVKFDSQLQVTEQSIVQDLSRSVKIESRKQSSGTKTKKKRYHLEEVKDENRVV